MINENERGVVCLFVNHTIITFCVTTQCAASPNQCSDVGVEEPDRLLILKSVCEPIAWFPGLEVGPAGGGLGYAAWFVHYASTRMQTRRQPKDFSMLAMNMVHTVYVVVIGHSTDDSTGHRSQVRYRGNTVTKIIAGIIRNS